VFGAPSKYVFISYSSADRLHSIVERAERVGSTVGNDALMLVDTSEQIQAVLQEQWLASTELPKDIDLYVFVLTPGLAHRLGPSRPGRDISRGLYEIHLSNPFVVEDDPSVEMVFRKLTDWLLRARSAMRARSHEEHATKQVSVQYSDSQDDVGTLIGLRRRLRDSIPMLDSEQWGKWRGVTTNPSATLAKYREQGRLFSVREGRNYLYPRLQFDQDAAPLEAIADVLKVVPEDARGWPLLSWFEAPSTLLGGRKPSEVLAKDPAAVRAAAADFYSDD
jgi:hypothetical protein